MKKILPLMLIFGITGTTSAALVAHYEFEGNVNDSAGSNHGTLINGAAFGIGPTY